MTQNELFRFVKRKLGLPYVEFEKTDDELREILQDSTLPIFNRHIPAESNMYLDVSDKNIKTDKPNEFWLQEPNNYKIITVQKVLPKYNDLFMHNYPMDIAFRQFKDIPNWALQVMQAETAYVHSPMNMSFKFLAPSKIRITPVQQANVIDGYTISYQHEHDLDLSTIAAQYETYLLELFLADVKIEIGNIRKKYQELSTPFGTIPVNGDDLISQGKEEREAIKELFKEQGLPNIIIKVQ